MEIDNKRNNFRVDILMPIRWQILDEAEIDLVKKGLGTNLLTHNYLKSPERETSVNGRDKLSQKWSFKSEPL